MPRRALLTHPALACCMMLAATAAVAQTPPGEVRAGEVPAGASPARPTEQKSTEQTPAAPSPEAMSVAQPASPTPAAPVGEAQAATPSPDTPAAAAEPAAMAANRLRIATFAGGYGMAQRQAVIDPFAAARGIAVEIVARDSADIATGADVVEIGAGDLERLCGEGRLLPLDPAILPDSSEGNPASEDFLPGSLKRCGVGSLAWSAVIAANRAAFKGRPPMSPADAFDTRRFPGKRAFLRRPQHLMEAVLIADGVPARDVYTTLATNEGVDRVLGRLDGFFRDIIWVEDAKAAMEAVESGQAAIAQVFSGRAFFSLVRGADIALVWDGQIYALNYWAIPAATAAPDLAKEFVAHATAPQQLAAVAVQFPYGPTRVSALPLSRRHAVADVELAPYLPTTPENLSRALAFDEAWWAQHRARIETRFDAWLKDGEARVASRDSRAAKPPVPEPRPRP
ncbi:MAG: extracellular solute-binding protein [Hyphomicrobiaceae bacterium]|nr:extracellular solute-binding protein [Hyphomicrobiaceae bacterium]